MKVTIRVGETVRPLLVAWGRSLRPDPLDARLFAGFYFRELQDRLAARGGMPPDAIPEAGSAPPSFWCELCGGTWVLCTIAEERRRLWWVRSRTVEITDLRTEPGSQFPPARRPG